MWCCCSKITVFYLSCVMDNSHSVFLPFGRYRSRYTVFGCIEICFVIIACAICVTLYDVATVMLISIYYIWIAGDFQLHFGFFCCCR